MSGRVNDEGRTHGLDKVPLEQSAERCDVCDILDAMCAAVSPLARAIWLREDRQDLLIVAPRRHVADWASATPNERTALLGLVEPLVSQHTLGTPASRFVLSLDNGVEGHLRLCISAVDAIARSPELDDAGLPSVQNVQSALPHLRALVRGGDDPLLAHLTPVIASAAQVDIIVSFVLTSGVRLLEEHLRDVLDRHGRVRVLTGDYLGITEPDALRRLLDLGPSLELRMFESAGQSFHPKSYICVDHDGKGTAFIGSSNLSHTALRTGVEWNYRLVESVSQSEFTDVRKEFDAAFLGSKTRLVDYSYISQYESRRPRASRPEVGVGPEPLEAPAQPHEIQREALLALDESRRAGNAASLVVIATGLGKTWLSAFDVTAIAAKRVLFVAHREEILDQAVRTFRAIRPAARLGKYTGRERTVDADVLFASVQALSRRTHLERFAPDTFDYIIVDEFHHASAATYRRLLDHFTPRFLLGLTATAARSDGADLLSLCGNNLAYSCDLIRGIRRGLLAPFDYYGVPDDVDYANIPWRNGRFDESELTARVAIAGRADNAREQLAARGGSKTLAFCVSQRHADFMRANWRQHGLRVASVHSGPSSDARTRSLEQLQAGDLDVLFAVDMFNEGVDLPDVDTILMLRPTESAVLWLQQFGRGLRFRAGKRLKVIDYIGNHRSFLQKPRTLFQLGEGSAEIANALRLLEEGNAGALLPPGCTATYDLEAKEILRALIARDGERPQALKSYYEDFRDQHGVRPSASEVFRDGYDPRSVRLSHGSWLQFVRAMGDLDETEETVEERLRPLLSRLDSMAVRRSDTMLVILALLAEEAVPGSLSLDRVVARVRILAMRSAAIRRDLGELLENDEALREDLLTRALVDWSEVRSVDGTRYVRVEDDQVVCSTFTTEALDQCAAEQIRELADWRLSAYLDAATRYDGAPRIYCKVSHSGESPILFLPSRDNPGIPEGWVDVVANGEPYHAKFAKIAVNVVKRPESDENVLPSLLREWFGPDAGRSGTRQSVVFERVNDAYSVAPSRPETEQGPERWKRYPRAKMPELFGITLSSFDQQMGVIERPGITLLFVTLDKGGKKEEHKYKDHFLSPDKFEWQSQNRTKQDSKSGRRLRSHAELNIAVHLFVRQYASLKGKAQPFLYCGTVDFESWHGERPITVKWKLKVPVPVQFRTEMEVPASATDISTPGAPPVEPGPLTLW